MYYTLSSLPTQNLVELIKVITPLSMNKYLLDLLKVGLGTKDRLSVVPSEDEWAELMTECRRHAVGGIGWQAVSRLPKDQEPPLSTFAPWYLLRGQICQKSCKAEYDASRVEKALREDGIRACIIKGQGAARFYPDPLLRQSGDVDLWVECDRVTAVDYVRRKLGVHKVEARIHHVDYPIFKGTITEIHYFPMFMYSFFRQRRLEKFFEREKNRQMENTAKPIEGKKNLTDFHCPTAEFNAVFMLTHIMRHLFEEGIGFRQLIDYFYVLRALPLNETGSAIAPDVKSSIMRDIRYLGMGRFVRAIMFIMREAFDMEERYMLCDVDEANGRRLLEEIMYTGNFGIYDSRDIAWKNSGSKLHLFIGKFLHNIRLWRLCPEEVLAGPLFRTWHYCWRRSKGYIAK